MPATSPDRTADPSPLAAAGSRQPRAAPRGDRPAPHAVNGQPMETTAHFEHFQRLQDCVSEVFLIRAGGDRDPIMHHKFCVIFCVIDRATVIIAV
jgi:hypothetical protein